MRLKVFTNEKTEEEVFFKLVQDSTEITLQACDYAGRLYPQGNILSISSSGLSLYSGVSTRLGIPIDENTNKIKLV